MAKAKQTGTANPASQQARSWAERKFDVDFLVDSGLLFQLNHELFHPLGLALTVRTADGDKKTLGFKDKRAEPGKMVFDDETAAAGREKLNQFMVEWGLLQLQRRRLGLGREVQDINPKDE